MFDELILKSDMIINGIAFFFDKNDERVTGINLDNLNERFCFLTSNGALVYSTMNPSCAKRIVDHFIDTWEYVYG
ncbi:MAG: hypothetical protein MJZ34_03035 [Paludibacteraceae bacterium]|nr:hypothetical protein [Paludibacteraceae bacterium]